jgi:RNA polymerase sigma-70 factor (ECF subfamily)
VNWPSLTPEELIAACIDDGHEAAWEEFVRRFRPVIAGTVLRTASRFGDCSPQLVDDLAQETYLKLCSNRSRILREFRPQSEDSIFGLLKTVAFSVVQDHFRGGLAVKRGGGKQESALDTYMESAVAGREGLPQIERDTLLGEIDDCLAAVTEEGSRERDRQIFWLYYRHGMTARAIGAIARIGLTPKGVESVIQRLTGLIRRRLVETRLHNPQGKPSGNSL